ncbi:MAG TPA: hypothetical protein VGZ51_04490, partial [Actinomycetota bacterium]|nr:hypothetical protein [Actinomycetota bacterium]
ARTGYRAFVVRVVPLLVLTLLAFALLAWGARWIRAAASRWSRRRGSVRIGSYEFDPRRDQANEGSGAVPARPSDGTRS